MKKILAVLLAAIMMFSVALIPASAADTAAETEVTFDLEKFEADVYAFFDFVEQLIASIHNLVGGIMGVLEKECALCGELHIVADAGAAA